jgi:hypothetical protein
MYIIISWFKYMLLTLNSSIKTLFLYKVFDEE